MCVGADPAPRVALGAAVAAAVAPGLVLKSLLMAGATATVATVATGYCPIKCRFPRRPRGKGAVADAEDLPC